MLDPLGQSQVIPYLKELSKLGVRFTLLSYEREHAFERDGQHRCRELGEELLRYGIEWHRLRYHQRPSLPATVFDVAAGVRLASRLVRRNKIEMVHARAHVPAVIALALKWRFRIKMIFDIRGLMAEEYTDAGHWNAGSIPSRITKSMEGRVLRATDGVVTLTDRLWAAMQSWPDVNKTSIAHQTIPCCIDLERFCFNDQSRAARRAELGIDNRFVLVYSGSIGGWYMTEEMASFFAALKRRQPDAFFLWLTTGPSGIVEGAMTKLGIEPSDYAVRSVAPAEVSSFLSAGDAGIAFYRPGVSRLGTSPVKVSEYLACGLPVVINAGIGDSDELITKEGIGSLVAGFNEAAYAGALDTIEALTRDVKATRSVTRGVAERLFNVRGVGVERYARLYEAVLNGSN
jgi:glycosyltransferase involved in cell wall biosynthesis